MERFGEPCRCIQGGGISDIAYGHGLVTIGALNASDDFSMQVFCAKNGATWQQTTT